LEIVLVLVLLLVLDPMASKQEALGVAIAAVLGSFWVLRRAVIE
jgi:hypothetical protein